MPIQSYNQPSLPGKLTTKLLTSVSSIISFNGIDVDILIVTDTKTGGTFEPYVGVYNFTKS